MILNRVLFFLLLFLFSHLTHGKTISVSLLKSVDHQSIEVKITRGNYTFSAQGKIYQLEKGNEIRIHKGLNVSIGDSIHLKVDQLNLKGHDYVNHFILSSHEKSIQYDDDLRISMLNGKISLINDVDIDHYVAGVVEGEAGYNLQLEYYKLQAILCRTYALKNMNRHSSEGFNLCDEVHCQVYHKKCTKNDIIQATASTSGLVVVDNDLNLINTTFHSNCGGQTCNSEDVWISELSYLKSVQDTFCIDQPHARWKKEVPRENFESILLKNGQLDSLEIESVLKFCQDTLRYSNKKLIFTKLTKMRSDYKLNSTFFSIESLNDSVVFHGKGFGHGVGLCQEGGMKMSELGYSYVDILKYYYTSIHIVNQKALLFFKEE